MRKGSALEYWLIDMVKVAKLQGGMPYDHLNAMGTMRNRTWFNARAFSDALNAWRAGLPGGYQSVTDWVERTRPTGNDVAEFLTDLIERTSK